MLTRREVLQMGAGATAALVVGPPAATPTPTKLDLIERAIPSSGETIPAIGIGTARRYNVGEAAEERHPLLETVRTFAEAGGKLIDTAPSYGNAEPVVGDLVRELGIRDDLFLATKVAVGRRRGGGDQPAPTPEQILSMSAEQMDRSFARFYTDRIDLMQIHNLSNVDAVLPVLREMKQEGRIRYLGVTTSSERQYEGMEAVMRREELDFVQLDYAIDNRGVEERLLPLALDRGQAVLVNLPFGRSRLFQRVGDRPLPEWAAEFDCGSWAQFFLKYLVGHPAVTCVIPGTAQIRYASDNIQAAQGRLPTPTLRQRMVQFLEALPE